MALVRAALQEACQSPIAGATVPIPRGTRRTRQEGWEPFPVGQAGWGQPERSKAYCSATHQAAAQGATSGP